MPELKILPTSCERCYTPRLYISVATKFSNSVGSVPADFTIFLDAIIDYFSFSSLYVRYR